VDGLPHVFAGLRPEHVRAEPFPHAILDNALPTELYRELAETKPTYTQIASPPPHPSNRRMPCSAHLFQILPHLPGVWKRFTARNTRPDATRHLAEVFAAHWHPHLPSRRFLETARYGLLGRDRFDDHEILCDARLEITSPVLEAPSSHRTAHLDGPYRIFSALLYLRAPEDDSTGGGLEIFRWRSAPTPRAGALYTVPEDSVELVATIPYAANRLVVFPNCIDALHGAQVRGVTPHERSFVFITAERPYDLF